MQSRYWYLTEDGWYGDPNSARGTTETLIRSMAIQIVATASFGHLMSLRNVSGKAPFPLLLYILGSVIFPLLPLAQLLRSFRSTIIRACRTRPLGTQIRFYASACLGMHGTISRQDGNTEPILNFDLSRLRPTRMRYNVLWFGRMIILLALLVQFAGTLVLWVRRAVIYQGMDRLWPIDNRNLPVAISGMLVVLSSAAILALNTKWNISDDGPLQSLEEQPLGNVSTGNQQGTLQGMPITSGTFTIVDSSSPPTDDVINSVSITSPVSRERTTQNNSYHNPRFNLVNAQILAKWRAMYTHIAFVYRIFRRINSSLSNWLLGYYPLEVQWDLELAYLLHMGFYTFVSMSGNDLMDRVFGWQISQYAVDRYSLYVSFPITPTSFTVYYLPCLVILLHTVIWSMSHPTILQYIPKRCRVICHEIDFWLRSGRTIFSLCFSFLLFLPVLFQAFLVRNHIYVNKFWERVYQRDERAHQPGYLLTFIFWKDPWTDYMYII